MVGAPCDCGSSLSLSVIAKYYNPGPRGGHPTEPHPRSLTSPGALSRPIRTLERSSRVRKRRVPRRPKAPTPGPSALGLRTDDGCTRNSTATPPFQPAQGLTSHDHRAVHFRRHLHLPAAGERGRDLPVPAERAGRETRKRNLKALPSYPTRSHGAPRQPLWRPAGLQCFA